MNKTLCRAGAAAVAATLLQCGHQFGGQFVAARKLRSQRPQQQLHCQGYYDRKKREMIRSYVQSKTDKLEERRLSIAAHTNRMRGGLGFLKRPQNGDVAPRRASSSFAELRHPGWVPAYMSPPVSHGSNRSCSTTRRRSDSSFLLHRRKTVNLSKAQQLTHLTAKQLQELQKLGALRILK